MNTEELKFLELVRSKDTSYTQQADLSEALRKAEKAVTRSLGPIIGVVNGLDPAVHPVAVTFVLNLQATIKGALMGDETVKTFTETAIRLMMVGDPTLVAIERHRFVTVCLRVAAVCTMKEWFTTPIAPLRRALDVAATGPNLLSPLHSEFVKFCLLSKHLRVAADVLDRPILGINSPASSLTPLHYVTYFYYGGMVFTALKRFDQALEFFKTCICTPASAASAVVVEAWKKYVLVSLLVNESVAPLPKFVAPVVTQALPLASGDYTGLADKYASRDLVALREFVESKRENFEKDNNMALVEQVMRNAVDVKLKQLTLVYVTLSLADVAEKVGLPDAAAAEAAILRLVDADRLAASIDRARNVVVFREDADGYDDPATMEALSKAVAETLAIGDRLRVADETLAKSSAYARKTVGQLGSGGGGGGGGAGGSAGGGGSGGGAGMGAGAGAGAGADEVFASNAH